MITSLLLRIAHLPGADTFLSFIGRRILGAFSLIRTAILVMGVANVLLFQYLDSAEARERNKLAEQGKLDHLSFVVQTQIQSYESAVWQTGRLPATISLARDLYTSEATADLAALRKLDGSMLAPGGPLHDFISNYIRLTELWQNIIPAIELGASPAPLRTLWTSQQGLITATPALVDAYLAQAQQDLVTLQHDKDNAKQAAMVVSIIISLISFALSIALAVVLTRQIVPPVTRLRDALQQVATGDLSPRALARGKDEISALLTTFNAAIAKLRDLLTAVRTHALGISEESRRLREAYADGETECAPGEAAPPEPPAQGQALAIAAPASRVDSANAMLEAPLVALEQLATATAEVAGTGEGTGEGSVQPAHTVAGVNQLISQVAELARRSSLLAESARQAAVAATPDVPGFAQLTSNLQGLDAEAKQMSEQLRALVGALQSVQNRMSESTRNLDRAADDLRKAIEQFQLQGES